MDSLRATAATRVAEAVAFGDLHAPSLQGTPFFGAGQKHRRRLHEMRARHDVAASAGIAPDVGFAGSVLPGRQAQIGADIADVGKRWGSSMAVTKDKATIIAPRLGPSSGVGMWHCFWPGSSPFCSVSPASCKHRHEGRAKA